MKTTHSILAVFAFVLAALALADGVSAYGYGSYGAGSYGYGNSYGYGSNYGYRTNSPTMYGGQYTSYGYGNIGGYYNAVDGYHLTSPYNQYPVANVYVYNSPQFRGHQSNWDYSNVYRDGYTGAPRSQTPTSRTSIPLASSSMYY